MKRHNPTVRLHIWLENGEMTMLGAGRVLLLELIDQHGSLRKAAKALGMSYRAAWGKIQDSEKALGVKLVELPGNKRDGCRLSEDGRLVKDLFQQWFEAVEQDALSHARDIFPWSVHSFLESHEDTQAEGVPRAQSCTGAAPWARSQGGR